MKPGILAVFCVIALLLSLTHLKVLRYGMC